MNGPITKAALFARLPAPPGDERRAEIRAEIRLLAAARKLVVLDDDPTGTQTVHGVPVLTSWSETDLAAEFHADSPCFYILTNSRSLPETQARALNAEIARHLNAVAPGKFTLVSRGDSTLRGHFPAETEALSAEAGPFGATVLMPYFEAGERFTVGDIHYLADGPQLLPVAETPFARDAAFSFRSSNLREYIQEKTGGRTLARDVRSISIEQLRSQTPAHLARFLRDQPLNSFVVVNACHPADAEIFALATLLAEEIGARLLFRTAAQFVAARLGLESRGPWRPFAKYAAGLVVVGSHVPKTTAQLQPLLAAPAVRSLKLEVGTLLDQARRGKVLAEAAAETDSALAAQQTPVIYTSREFVGAGERTLEIGQTISRALVELVRRIQTRPGFLLAKGGITSSDLATQALGVKRAIVLGQILPGVPVWELGPETRHQGVPFVVFPGNVGDECALARAVAILRTGSNAF